MVTKSRNVNTSDFTGLQNRHSFGDFDRITINKNLDRIIGVREMNPGTTNRGSRRKIWSRFRCGGGSFRGLKLRLGDDGAEEEEVSRVGGVGFNGPRS